MKHNSFMLSLYNAMKKKLTIATYEISFSNATENVSLIKTPQGMKEPSFQILAVPQPAWTKV